MGSRNTLVTRPWLRTDGEVLISWVETKMNFTGRTFSSRGLALGMVAWIVLGLAGCGTILQPKHRVNVDSICAPGVTKPAGQSFRLVARRAILGTGSANIPVIAACVSAALAHAGMYEAPAGVAPDLVVEVSCGQESAARADPAGRETFLELSARPNSQHALETTHDPEIWNVRVSIMGLAGRIETAMPLLSAVAANYTATDSRFQTLIEVPQNNASIAAVREAAMKTLEARNSAAGNAAASSASTTDSPPAK